MNTQQFLLSAWKWHPTAFIICTLILAVYAMAWRTVPGAENGKRKITGKQIGLLSLALGIFLLTLVSPVDALADGYLFSAHMLQHLLLLLVVPPLLLMAWPKRSADFSPLQVETSSGAQKISTPPSRFTGFRILCSWLAGVGSMWFWHVPTLCDAATSYSSVRTVQIISLLVLGTLFWQPVLAPQSSRRLPALPGVLYLFTACVGCTLLGIIITFTPVSVCPIYMHPMDHAGLLPMIRNGWGLTPAVDQQIGGLMMWVPACLIYLSAILGLLGRWYAAAEPKAQKPSVAAPQPDTSKKAEPHPPAVDHPLSPNIKPKASHA